MALFGDTRINATFTATDRVSPVVRGLRGEVSRLGSRTGGPLGGLIGGIGGLNLGMVGLGIGVVGAVSALGDFAKAAVEDQLSVDRMTTSLKANVPAWDGSTKAIDGFIKKGQDLAFTDDDIRESITQLVPRTHDLEKAMDLTRQAMDLARLKGISLTDAAGILGKVFDGNASAAKRAGLAIDTNASSTEMLAQIQAAAKGQAETYGESQAGTLSKINIQWSEMTESLGKGVLDVINGIGKIGTAFDDLHKAIDPNYKLMQDTDVELRKMAEALGLNADEITAWSDAQKASQESMAATTKGMHENDLATEIAANNAANLQSNIVGLTDKYAQYGLTIDDVVRIQGEVSAGTYNATAAVNTNADAVAAAQGLIDAYTASQSRAASATRRHEAAAGALQRRLNGLHDTTIHVNVLYSDSGRHTVLEGGRASGGPVRGDSTYIVGENGPEVLHMGSGGSGYVTQGTASAGGGQEHTTIVMLDGAVIARQVDRWNGRQYQLAGRSHSRN